MAGLSDTEVKALVDGEIRQSIGYYGGKLAQARQRAEMYFLGEAKGDLSPPEIEGRSTVVATTVRNTILWMQPQLMKMFCSGDKVVELTPTEENDEDKASIATEYLNYLFYKQNPGYQIVSTWITDALLQKNGIIKVWWDGRNVETREEYKALDDVALGMLLDDKEVEPIEQNAYPDEDDAKERAEALEQLKQQLAQAQQALAQMQQQMGPQPPQQPGQPPAMPPQLQQAMQQAQALEQQIQQIEAMPPKMLYDVSFKRVKTGGKLCVENVPPEEFLISRRAKTIKDGPCGHRIKRTLSDLRAMGYKNVDDISSDQDAQLLTAEAVERASWDDESPYLQPENDPADPSMRTVWLIEWYQRMDVDGDGIAEWRKIVRAGDQLLENVECDGPPFVSITPIPLPHRFFGMSIADLSMEPQRVETSLLRSQLDNAYLETNGRYFAIEGQVNLDDLLTSRPGGVVRIKQPGAVGRLDQGAGNSGQAMQMMEWFQDFTENATGWTRYSQGGDSDALNKTATGVNIITNRADARLELIARNFAETGFTDLFRLMLKLTCQHQNKKAVIRLGDKWTNIDPREWTNQFDLTINVGLGTGNKDQQVAHIAMLLDRQMQGLQIGVATPANIYHSASKMTQLLGFKDDKKFWTEPDPNKPPPDPAQGAMQQQMQLEQMKIQAQGQQKQAELVANTQAKQGELQMNAQIEAMKAQYAERQAQANREHEAQLEQVKAQMQAQVDMNRDHSQMQQKTLEMQQEAELERMKQEIAQAQHQAEQAYQLEIEKIKARTQILVARIGAQAPAIPGELAAEAELFTDQPSAADDIRMTLAQTLDGFRQALETMNRPKQIVRDESGRAVGLQ